METSGERTDSTNLPGLRGEPGRIRSAHLADDLAVSAETIRLLPILEPISDPRSRQGGSYLLAAGLVLLNQQSGCVLGHSSVGPTNEAKAVVALTAAKCCPARWSPAIPCSANGKFAKPSWTRRPDLLVVKDNQRELKEAIASEFATGRFPLRRKEPPGSAAGGRASEI